MISLNIRGMIFQKMSRARGGKRTYKSPVNGSTYTVWMRGFKDWVVEVDGVPMHLSFVNQFQPVYAIRNHESGDKFELAMMMIRALPYDVQNKIVSELSKWRSND